MQISIIDGVAYLRSPSGKLLGLLRLATGTLEIGRNGEVGTVTLDELGQLATERASGNASDNTTGKITGKAEKGKRTLDTVLDTSAGAV